MSDDGYRTALMDWMACALGGREERAARAARAAGEGLLERVACSTDGRGAFARLTPAGRRRLAAAGPTYAASLRALFLSHFGEEELDTLGDLFERALARLPRCC